MIREFMNQKIGLLADLERSDLGAEPELYAALMVAAASASAGESASADTPAKA